MMRRALLGASEVGRLGGDEFRMVLNDKDRPLDKKEKAPSAAAGCECRPVATRRS
jgi:GGDEF domain-containing protein